MPSLVARMLAVAFRVARKRPMETVEGARERIDEAKDDPEPPHWVAKRHETTRREVGGFASYTVLARDREEDPDKAVLYVHGGSYISEISPWHWVLISRMADVGCRVEVPIYGLAPQHTYREAFGFLHTVYRDLLEHVAPERTVFAGDSAGAGLALALAQTLPGEGLPQPARLILVSPWTDLTMSNPDIAEVEGRDPWLSPVGLKEAAKVWAGGDDLSLPRLSPVNGVLSGLPPMDLYIGTRDVFLPDTRRLRALVARAGGEVDLHEEEGAFHVYPLVPVPEGSRARARIIGTVQDL
ncbi:alpha/beta hydrolase [Nocardiopsis dassonvillei]|uniref:alpha/beta hydrolase fold domain-containing protein n=1 Tax=Nocardiopsis dassonvillei TaxID=2014 RepID=UPI00200BD15E|nr:alpha/beta hydrolase [Nocardiopsis dassonvillei]MCK9870185.1 alpha/beta hydrolase [Nocardiopsis dassonvillei]